MDAISYSHSAKQEKRIKNVIADPDSTSGVLTVPKTIASGENITIPSGRVAVLPNVQIDGTLNVQGDVFIPSGATLSGVVEKVTSTDNAIVRFDGTTGKVQNSGVIIDDNGNIGIGTSSPITKLSINNSASGSEAIRIGNSVGGNGYVQGSTYIGLTHFGISDTSFSSALIGVIEDGTSSYNASLIFSTRGSGTDTLATERMRIDSAGNVGIGVNPSAWGSGIRALDISQGTSLANGGSYVTSWFAGNAYYNGGWKYKNNEVASLYEHQGVHKWYIAPSGTAGNAITWTQAMTLDANGNLLVGTSTNGMNNQTGFNVTNPSTATYCSIGHASGTVNGIPYLNFAYNGTQIGSVYQNTTSSVTFATTSDYRLKENIRPADCKRFMDIKFVDYERIDGGNHECGIIAHELQEIYPDLVTGEKDATEIRKVEISPAVEEVKDEDGNIITEAVEAVYEEQEFPVYQQVNYMGLIARIGTVVQQQAKLIEAMRAEIDELKGIGGAK